MYKDWEFTDDRRSVKRKTNSVCSGKQKYRAQPGNNMDAL